MQSAVYHPWLSHFKEHAVPLTLLTLSISLSPPLPFPAYAALLPHSCKHQSDVGGDATFGLQPAAL